MFKRILTALLAFALIFALCITAFAASEDLPILPGRDFQQGDINLDGKISIKDATLIQKHLGKIKELTAEQLVLADVDGIEGVNIKDATYLQKWLARLVDRLFGGKEDVTRPTAPVESEPIIGGVIGGTTGTLRDPDRLVTLPLVPAV